MAKKKDWPPTFTEVTVAKLNGRWQPVIAESCIVVKDARLGMNMDEGGYQTLSGAKEAMRFMNRRRREEAEERT